MNKLLERARSHLKDGGHHPFLTEVEKLDIVVLGVVKGSIICILTISSASHLWNLYNNRKLTLWIEENIKEILLEECHKSNEHRFLWIPCWCYKHQYTTLVFFILYYQHYSSSRQLNSKPLQKFKTPETDFINKTLLFLHGTHIPLNW